MQLKLCHSLIFIIPYWYNGIMLVKLPLPSNEHLLTLCEGAEMILMARYFG